MEESDTFTASPLLPSPPLSSPGGEAKAGGAEGAPGSREREVTANLGNTLFEGVYIRVT